MDVAADDSSVDGTGDVDDGEGDTKGHLGHEGAGGEEGGGFDVLADEGVDDGTGEGVDDDLDNTQSPDGLDVVLGGVHLVHEGELANGETVGEDDVGDGDHGVGKGDVLLGPGGPVDSGHSAGLVTSPDAGGDHGHTDSQDDGDEVDVSENGDLGE